MNRLTNEGAFALVMVVMSVVGCGGDDSSNNNSSTVPPVTGTTPGVMGGPASTGTAGSPAGIATGGVSTPGMGTPPTPGTATPPTPGTATPPTPGTATPPTPGTATPPTSGQPSIGPNWTMMGGDARNNYYNPNEKTLNVENAGKIELLWMATVTGNPPGSPLVVDGKIYVKASGGTYAFDINGKQLWVREDITGTATLAYDGGFIYANTSTAELYKLNASDGKTVWGPVMTYAGADGFSSPIVADGKVVVGHSSGYAEIGPTAATAAAVHGGIFAADVATGKEAWHYWTTGAPDSMENGACLWSSVSIADGVVYAGTGNNYSVLGPSSDAIHAIDLATGKRKWMKQVRANDVWSSSYRPAPPAKAGEDTDFGANPIIADVGGKKLVAAGDKGSVFWALDRETGEIVWSTPNLSASHSASTGGVLNNGAFDGKFFYVISNDSTGKKSILHKLDGDGKDVYTKEYPKLTWGAPSLANGLLLLPVDNELVILKAEDGTELKRFMTGGSITAGAAAIVDGKIVVASGGQAPYPGPKPNNQILCYGLK